MRVVVLGTAAGGGLPQWNCACDLCERSRSGDPAVPPRLQDCLAISATGRNWYLLNASPDLRAQINATPELAPGPGRRETPIRGALLTDAELDHTLGLTLLREGRLTVWAPRPVLDAAAVRDLLAHYNHWTWYPAEDTFRLDDGHLECAVFPLSGKRPRYAQSASPAPDWVVAYRITDVHTGGSLLYAPCLASWPPGFTEFVTGATCALLDGTFLSADEMASTTGQPDQQVMGHLPITASLPLLPIGVTAWHYTHLNNTNPAAAQDSTARATIEATGTTIATDHTRFDL
ncbi:pyrroloquinoline quinone biosynthesis protein PqqB [Actinokineospora diospyrosa]|uniref:Coenzyme PQQ synthesis protein B n=1 Tax=Actinokineospora diospyrosa TaxID=103728 RepID=A0ABT1IJD3_9PSEU|nr:pyrroloquinoline quinone biosynthesis protein PqqB [Actinokineospora diospyrosa]MCP2272759.1 pyrroloquinoline quinone biosynthesis protein B [Actinokineospora diospyrosa]